MKLSVPYYSQHIDVRDEEWQGKACTITNLKMVFDFFSVQSPSLDDLVKEGIEIGGYGEHGWTHDHIVLLAHNYGLSSYKQEFRSRNKEIEESMLDKGFEKIQKEIRTGRPVIVSTKKDNGSFHTVLVIGFEEPKGGSDYGEPGFFYNDPDAKKKENGENQHISYNDFRKKWRGLCIFFES